jgi:hypothetical protein
MALVEVQHRLLVLLAIGRAHRLVLARRFLHGFRGETAQAVGLLNPQRYRGRRIGYDQRTQSRRSAEGMHHREHAAPGLAEHVIALGEPQVLEQS